MLLFLSPNPLFDMTSQAARNAIALLPRTLRISPSTPITRTHLLALYKEQLRVAHSFPSYNFKEYFIRRTRNKFRTELPHLLDSAYAPAAISSSSSNPSSSTPSAPAESAESDSIYAPTGGAAVTAAEAATTPEARLREWYGETLSELAVMARAAVVNRLYEAPKLVIEGKGRVMVTGGGGAGAEAR